MPLDAAILAFHYASSLPKVSCVSTADRPIDLGEFWQSADDDNFGESDSVETRSLHGIVLQALIFSDPVHRNDVAVMQAGC